MTPEPSSLERVSVVLVRTSHPGNVGAAARAMKVMGLTDLRLAAPRFDDIAARPEAIAFASGATDVLRTARRFETLDEAIGDASLAIAVSAEPREFGPPVADPETCAAEAIAEIAAHPAHRVAFVFGTERTGLSIEQVQRCQRLASIPGAPGYASLNLAQAVQVLAYCIRRAALADVAGQAAAGQGVAAQGVAAQGVAAQGVAARASVPDVPGPAAGAPRLAGQQAIEGLFAHLERALIAIGYLDPQHPKKLMPRLRRLFSRARIEEEEVDLLRGICKLMERRPPADR